MFVNDGSKITMWCEGIMNRSKRNKLEKAGWRFGSAKDFLELTKEEQAIVEIRLALADEVKVQRQKRGISQSGLAARMKSSQSRVAKIEAGDPSVSVDLLVRAVLATGASKKDLVRALSTD
jgi:ribosome-binding protein aMBF1 (putative translation factor)